MLAPTHHGLKCPKFPSRCLENKQKGVYVPHLLQTKLQRDNVPMHCILQLVCTLHTSKMVPMNISLVPKGLHQLQNICFNNNKPSGEIHSTHYPLSNSSLPLTYKSWELWLFKLENIVLQVCKIVSGKVVTLFVPFIFNKKIPHFRTECKLKFLPLHKMFRQGLQ